MPAQMKSPDDLFRFELAYMHVFEQNNVQTLQQLLQEVSSEEARQPLEHHLEETREQVQLLAQIFQTLGEEPQKVTVHATTVILPHFGRHVLVRQRSPSSFRDVTPQRRAAPRGGPPRRPRGSGTGASNGAGGGCRTPRRTRRGPAVPPPGWATERGRGGRPAPA
jgi:hypothetical protein